MNLLHNPGFNGPFVDWQGDPLLNVADGWEPFWQALDAPRDMVRPMFKALFRASSPERVRTGLAAQAYFAEGATYSAGLLQRVPAVPGQHLRLSTHGYMWSSVEDDILTSVEPTQARLRIGIDPHGGNDPDSPHIVWSLMESVYDEYELFTVEAEAYSPHVTVFLQSRPLEARPFNYTFWEDATLEVIGEMEPGMFALGSDDEWMLSAETLEASVDSPVIVSVTSKHHLRNVRVQVSGPELGRVMVRFLEKTVTDRDIIRRWEFVPHLEGEYTIVAMAEGKQPHTVDVAIEASTVEAVERGDPRIQYERNYLLMPPGTTTPWLDVLVESGIWLSGQWTVGFNPDDAGIGDLRSRTVYVVNPHVWDQPMVQWYGQHYPGVRVVPVVADTPEELVAELREATL